jgi:spore coat polysaccharide biosynthesis protein SpsF (cytidylyltransferase family)
LDEVIIATSEDSNSDIIRYICIRNGIKCFSGSENDVLDRFYKAVKDYNPDIVLRITADCPLIDPQIITKLLTSFTESGQYDYMGVAAGAGVANEKFNGHRFPDGLDTEVFYFKLLETAWNEAKDPLEREHVTPFIWKRPERFKLGFFTSDVDYSHLRWTVDNLEDFELVEKIYQDLYINNPGFGLDDILNFFKRNPDLIAQNSHFIGKEGYEKFWK